MIAKNTYKLLGYIFLASVLFMPSAAVLGVGAGTMMLEPANIQVQEGDQFPVVVMVDAGGLGLKSATAVLSYDSAVLTVLTITDECTLFNMGGNANWNSSTITITCNSMPFDFSDGPLATILFEGNSAGVGNVSFTGASSLIDSDSDEILVDPMGGTYVVDSPPVEDEGDDGGGEENSGESGGTEEGTGNSGNDSENIYSDGISITDTEISYTVVEESTPGAVPLYDEQGNIIEYVLVSDSSNGDQNSVTASNQETRNNIGPLLLALSAGLLIALGGIALRSLKKPKRPEAGAKEPKAESEEKQGSRGSSPEGIIAEVDMSEEASGAQADTPPGTAKDLDANTSNRHKKSETATPKKVEKLPDNEPPKKDAGTDKKAEIEKDNKEPETKPEKEKVIVNGDVQPLPPSDNEPVAGPVDTPGGGPEPETAEFPLTRKAP